jgi:hypothetical protein
MYSNHETGLDIPRNGTNLTDSRVAYLSAVIYTMSEQSWQSREVGRMRRDQLQDDFEMLLRKMGHTPSRGYVERGQYQDGVRCLRCGYGTRPTTDENALEPCVVLDGERWAGKVA